jgi:hypothetical protein
LKVKAPGAQNAKRFYHASPQQQKIFKNVIEKSTCVIHVVFKGTGAMLACPGKISLWKKNRSS